ncbi:LEM domain [Dermatophagoides pteronyssinus]|uniref:LEM domain n=1 Tax=Dermatophagoides pteronyssinus TaxID=6956 RepID=A0ABQ8JNI1_DERPT|nr:LEM domain [Dermatophagoides pteronyssinus]
MANEMSPSFDMNITDQELRRRLINDHNIECGPVTTQTRRILLKKLIKLEQEKIVNDSNETNGTSNNGSMNDDQHEYSGFMNGDNHNGDHVQNIINIPDEDISSVETIQPTIEIRRSTTRRQSPRRSLPRRQTNNSEEIEAIKSFKEVEKTLKQPSFHKKSSKSFGIIQPSSASLNNFSSESSDDNDDVNEKVKLTSNTPNSQKISGITMPRVTESQTFRPISSLSRAPIRRSTKSTLFDIHKSNPSLLNYSDSESDSEQSYKKDKICQALLNHRPGLGRSRRTENKRSFTWIFTSLFQNIKRKLWPSQRTSSTANFSTSSNYISWALLIYNLDLTDYTFIEDKNKLLAPICNQNNIDSQIDCLQFESDKKPALNIIKEIKSFIDKRIYDTYCGSSSNQGHLPKITDLIFKRSDFEKDIQANLASLSSSVTRDVSLHQMNSNQLFNRDMSNAFKLIKLNTAWNIKVEDHFLSELKLMPNYNVNLPLQCSLKFFWKSNFWIIISSLAIGLFSIIFFLYYRYSKNLELQEQELVYELIEKSVELLQSPDEPQSMPVLHIRDTLLSPAEKKNSKYKRVWEKVVNQIENSDSRVKVEFKEIDGEEFKAWKWIASTNSPCVTDSENDNDFSIPASQQSQKIGGVEWQGQAFAFSNNKANQSSSTDAMEQSHFPEMNRNKNFQALTRFLKIRNIFEKEAQYVDSNWSKKIKNTILEKTATTSDNGRHDIVHIEIDDSTNEGLVFLKCGSVAGATNAFHALHGWWCEKKLVSVKFLKEDRYYQRFPHARYMDTPLQITSITIILYKVDNSF